ncbi:T-cell immunoglobulin and mucin domain-containing protein 4 isoform X2 [Cuculus canorus]|uniref:T-cell immunoglobulin and mucin domain-containing protein 4 isoform X2 n=1 Tax=Cuculus canorus TaxID=55661 RepID=UPI0023AB0C4E|nr:T-cell immunoglobulin and mucin domain-containing protein 4 isoform X2 [Cuculus canorus]
MSHFVLLLWIMIQTFIAHAASEDVVRGIIGQPVTLPCSYQVARKKDISDMCWGRGPCPNSKCNNKILHTAGNRVTYRKSPRYNLQGHISYGDVSLTIGKVMAGDAGTYCCRVEIPGWFNDIKKNVQLEVVRAPPVLRTTTTKAAVSPTPFRKTTFSPQATSGHQATAKTAVLLTTTFPPATTAPTDHQTTAETAVLLSTPIPEAITSPTVSPAVTTLETIVPPTFAVTTKDTFPETMVITSALPDFSTGFQAADMRTEEDDLFCSAESVPLPGGTKVNTEFPSTLLTAEVTENADTSLVVEDLPTAEIPASSSGKAGHDDKRDKFPVYAILIACLVLVFILFILMLSLFWKRKHTKKLIIKSLRPEEDLEKVFSGAEGENSIFNL